MAYNDYRSQVMQGRTKRVTAIGGVPARADGGGVNPKATAAKKKAGTIVNIVIAGGQGGGQAPMRPAPVMAPPVAAPMARRPPMPATGLGMAPPPPGALPMRKRGGSVKMDAGAASGLGRLEKTRAAKD